MGAFKEQDLEFINTNEYALKNIEQPFMGEIICGFPSPATDYLETTINLQDHLIKKPAATFLMRAKGDSMINAGIYPGDLLIIDRSITPRSGHIVVASLNGEFTLKRLYQLHNKITLYPENIKYKAIEINEESDFQIFGVATHNVHTLL